MKTSRFIKLFICILCMSLTAFRVVHAEPRVALVIGNGAYQFNAKLPNPVNDAADLSRTLRELGFTVTTLTDSGLSAMGDAIYNFRGALLKDPATVGVFIFSGHGLQSGGVNYLLPIDQDIRTEVELARKAIPAQEVLSYMNEARNSFNMVVLDACRNNPLSGATRSASRGLAAVASAPPQTLVVYSTDAGNVAEDGSGRNSPFALALMKYLKEPGLDAEAMLRRVTGDVQSATNYRQTPYKYSSLTKDFFFAGQGKTQSLAQDGGVKASGSGTMTVERSYGSVKVDAREAAKVFIDGVYKGDIPAGGSADITGVETGNRLLRLEYLDGKSEEKSLSVGKSGTAYASFSYVKPVPQGVGMVPVDGGSFSMGSTAGYDYERPVHSVSVNGFSMSVYEVTVGEFRSFVQETGYRTSAETSGGGFIWNGYSWEQRPDVNWKNSYLSQSDKDPVVLISWFDAVEYCNWKSKKEGLTPCYSVSGNSVNCSWNANGYRLPTEAEWEYAARGGKLGRGYSFSGGNDAGTLAWFALNSGGKTQPVGTKQANELGLYDMSGNVWEWCWDWYGTYSNASQTDPRGPSFGSYRIVRGGGYSDPFANLRPQNRYSVSPVYGNLNVGFRTVRKK